MAFCSSQAGKRLLFSLHWCFSTRSTSYVQMVLCTHRPTILVWSELHSAEEWRNFYKILSSHLSSLLKMEGRSQLMIIITCLLALAFLLVCISTGTENWTTVSETGKDADIIALNINQGLFDRCIVKKSRNRERTTSCYTLNSGKDGYKMQGMHFFITNL